MKQKHLVKFEYTCKDTKQKVKEEEIIEYDAFKEEIINMLYNRGYENFKIISISALA